MPGDILPEGFCSVEEALEELRAGRLIVLVDDPNRENEGDLVLAADMAKPETINRQPEQTRQTTR